ncbi:MAG: twin-arginine translocase TatA/TatE family subunit [Legionella sp.]|nr:MAG: twin-arginine translocase TatA/TatE family subunit [Legionella sp.]
MNSSEFLLILVVAVIVFGPNKLPMLARHLGLAMRKVNQFKNQAQLLWEQQLNELQLQDNLRKAEEADKHYLPNEQIKRQNDQQVDGNKEA